MLNLQITGQYMMQQVPGTFPQQMPSNMMPAMYVSLTFSQLIFTIEGFSYQLDGTCLGWYSWFPS